MNTTRITRLTAAILVGTLACATGLIGQGAATDDAAAKAAALAKATLNPIASLKVGQQPIALQLARTSIVLTLP